MGKLTYTNHTKERMPVRSITEKMVLDVLRKDKRPRVQAVENGTLEIKHALNWNAEGWLTVVTDEKAEIIITAKWERYSKNWNRLDRSEDYYHHRHDPENRENKIKRRRVELV